VSQPTERPRGGLFPGVDLSEAGRRGGFASAARRQRRADEKKMREWIALEDAILASNNGAAKVKVLEMRQRRERDVLARHRDLDRQVCQLLDMIDEEQKRLDGLRKLETDLQASLDGMRGEYHAVRDALDADSEALVAKLRALPKTDLETLLSEFVEFDDDEVAA
jgi:hypothetical protein